MHDLKTPIFRIISISLCNYCVNTPVLLHIHIIEIAWTFSQKLFNATVVVLVFSFFGGGVAQQTGSVKGESERRDLPLSSCHASERRRGSRHRDRRVRPFIPSCQRQQMQTDIASSPPHMSSMRAVVRFKPGLWVLGCWSACFAWTSAETGIWFRFGFLFFWLRVAADLCQNVIYFLISIIPRMKTILC